MCISTELRFRSNDFVGISSNESVLTFALDNYGRMRTFRYFI